MVTMKYYRLRRYCLIVFLAILKMIVILYQRWLNKTYREYHLRVSIVFVVNNCIVIWVEANPCILTVNVYLCLTSRYQERRFGGFQNQYNPVTFTYLSQTRTYITIGFCHCHHLWVYGFEFWQCNGSWYCGWIYWLPFNTGCYYFLKLHWSIHWQWQQTWPTPTNRKKKTTKANRLDEIQMFKIEWKSIITLDQIAITGNTFK